MAKVLAMILAGGTGDRLSILSSERAKPAVPFAGGYRIIDFTLSNCINSGISQVAVLTQYRPRSLNEHLGIGAPWDLDRRGAGLYILAPERGRKASDWYKGTADAVYQNLAFVREKKADLVLVLAGDHVYKMDYRPFLEFHQAKGAEVTVGAVEVSLEEACRFGILSVDEEGRVMAFEEKPVLPKDNLGSMGIYVFNASTLKESLEQDAQRHTSHDFGRDIVPSLIGRAAVYAFPFQGYWRDVGTVEAYWQANLELLDKHPPLDLCSDYLVVHTRLQERPPLKVGPRAKIEDSLICSGARVEGEVRRSILSPGVVVAEGARVVESIVFNDACVGQGATVHRSILDKEVSVGAGSRVGYGDDLTPNQDEPDHLNTGITIVGKRARIASGTQVGRNCKICPGVTEEDFAALGPILPSGSTVARPEPIALSLNL